MKNSIIIIFLAFIFLTSLSAFNCNKNDLIIADVVKLSATISDTNEVIHLGDTLKLRLVLPNVLNGINSYGSSTSVTINNLQEAFYAIRLYRLDTATSSSTIFWGNTPNNFTTVGYTDGFGVYTTTSSPFTSVLNIVPPSKGVYYLAVSLTPGNIRANNGYKANLITNFSTSNKHWQMLAYYYNVYYHTNVIEFLTSAQNTDNEGFGYYGFKVN
jgi:hypothetical protein